MDFNQALSVKNRRRTSRVEIPDLFVSVKRKRWLVLEEYIDVETMDINRGGIGVIASDLDLKLLENIRFHFEYDAGEYFIGGVVVYKYDREGLEFYGVMFTQIPHQFETLLTRLIDESTSEDVVIDMAQHEKTQKINFADIIKARQLNRSKKLGQSAIADARKTSEYLKKLVETQREKIDQVADDVNQSSTVPDTQRRLEVRYSTDVLVVRVRSRGLASFVDFIPTEPCDISFGGVSFSIAESEPRLSEKVRLELRYKNMVLRASGLVSYVEANDGRINYGVQFTMIPTKMNSLLKIMAANDSLDNQVVSK